MAEAATLYYDFWAESEQRAPFEDSAAHEQFLSDREGFAKPDELRYTLHVYIGGRFIALKSTEPALPEEITNAAAQLDKLLRLRRDWDSYNGRPVNEHIVEDALQVVIEGWVRCCTPAIFPTCEGGLNLLWRQNGKELEVEILSSGKYDVLFVDEVTGEEKEKTGLKRISELLPFISKVCVGAAG